VQRLPGVSTGDGSTGSIDREVLQPVARSARRVSVEINVPVLGECVCFPFSYVVPFIDPQWLVIMRRRDALKRIVGGLVASSSLLAIPDPSLKVAMVDQFVALPPGPDDAEFVRWQLDRIAAALMIPPELLAESGGSAGVVSSGDAAE